MAFIGKNLVDFLDCRTPGISFFPNPPPHLHLFTKLPERKTSIEKNKLFPYFQLFN
jgi:hypothetical protein